MTYLSALYAALFVSRVWAVHQDRPNIIWIMADDLGWGEVGLYPSSSAHGPIATPSLDKFGREGIVFTNAYAGYTVCGPSRTAFFTGRHSGQFEKHNLSGNAILVEQNVTTIARVLQQAGYQTGAFGKIVPLVSPLQQGFDVFVGQINQMRCHNMYPHFIDRDDGELNYELIGNNKATGRKLCMHRPEYYNYTVDVFHQEAMKWLGSVAHKSSPFFLYLSFTIPHAGEWGDGSHIEGSPVPSDLGYFNKPWPTVEKDHAAVITYLDMKVHDLMQRLKLLNIDHNTVVIFASDNGAHSEGRHKASFFDSTGGLQGGKRSLFEGGVRSPTMVRWPAVISPGRRSDFAWAFWDALPTFAELAHTSPPPGLDGMSIVPTLRGKEQLPHEYLYFTWALGYTIRVGKWKGVVHSCAKSVQRIPSMSDKMQLYNLEDDPFETKNLAEDNPSITVSMRKLVISKGLTCACYQCRHYLKAQDKLLQRLRDKLAGKNSIFIWDVDNAGDAMLHYRTLLLLKDLGLHVKIGSPKKAYFNESLIYAGAGHSDLLVYGRQSLEKNARNTLGNQILILFATLMHGMDDLLESFGKNVIIFAQELDTFHYLQNHTKAAQVFQALDMPFGLPMYAAQKKKSRTNLHVGNSAQVQQNVEAFIQAYV